MTVTKLSHGLIVDGNQRNLSVKIEQLIQRLITITLALTTVFIVHILMNQEPAYQSPCRDIRFVKVPCVE